MRVGPICWSLLLYCLHEENRIFASICSLFYFIYGYPVLLKTIYTGGKKEAIQPPSGLAGLFPTRLLVKFAMARFCTPVGTIWTVGRINYRAARQKLYHVSENASTADTRMCRIGRRKKPRNSTAWEWQQVNWSSKSLKLWIWTNGCGSSINRNLRWIHALQDGYQFNYRVRYLIGPLVLLSVARPSRPGALCRFKRWNLTLERNSV